jgi:hypothetical protein
LKFKDSQGEKTLEKEEKLNFKNLDIQSMFDPLFYKTTKKFDDLSMGKLLGSTLNINSNVLLKMDSSEIDLDL